tara:strand:+ start:47 stop:322 length:276 start_codon:yes stop_codon:yes gene_type:complete
VAAAAAVVVVVPEKIRQQRIEEQVEAAVVVALVFLVVLVVAAEEEIGEMKLMVEMDLLDLQITVAMVEWVPTMMRKQLAAAEAAAVRSMEM